MSEIADKAYLISLGAGLLVGIVNSFHVRSLAAPVIALVGLLGMLAGQQIIPLVSRHLFTTSTNIASQHNDQE